MRLDRARRIADAVLLEGYVLYPYRASAPKNRWRFSFGVLAPRAWSEAGGCEPWFLEARCLVEPAGTPRLSGRLRFLQARRRLVEEAVAGGGGAFRAVEALDAGGRLLVPWDEGELREIALDGTLAAGGPERVESFELRGDTEVEPVADAAGGTAGRVSWTRSPVRGEVRVACEPVDADRPLLRVRVRVENLTPWGDPGARREAILPASCLSTHLVLALEDGAFVSPLDPPEWAAAAAAACRSVATWPVLAGEAGERDLVLCAPIILYDHPRLAPESPGDFFDATEIDELLALRTSTLTEAEKREVRATDPRAAALLDRVEGLPPELLERLHGATRALDGAEMIPRPEPAPEPATFRPGDRVVLRPGARRTDAQDLLYAGHVATVRSVRRDVDDREWLAVTIDDDPAAELHDWYGRYHHFLTDEVERLAPAPAPEVGR
ncbi:hypothetical protein [Anaeromyxobacter oryzae]|uniref:Uncharacterized protein n=1 Tax=Anaeromyxobacter oryzae TaxID=2918170 RepID=A0ABM7WPH6_9BACT|nr:hypothetical protein [Anaeromyxobacter oryzae]BDG01371.1 hypothetical protein AMOR_03670 [Anaeromyxobacter oryzae]